MKVIATDLGGTKIAMARVSKSGKIEYEKRVPAELANGWPGLKRQVISLYSELAKGHRVKALGVASAGPLHAPSGTLLDPTNFGWKKKIKIPFTKEISKALGVPVVLENDAAAAILAEYWKGKAKKNSIIITLGTGLGVGVIVDGKLVRGARGLHPETSHIQLRPLDKSAPCGCGHFGCAEAFLSGKNLATRLGKQMGRKLRGHDVDALLAEGNKTALRFLREYSELMAEFIHTLVLAYYPEEIIFTGSFAKAAPFFMPQTQNKLKEMLARRTKTLPIVPKLRVSRLKNEAGVLGGAYVALNKNYF